MLRCSATRAMTRTLHEPWPKPKRPPSAGDPPSQSAAPQKTAESISRKPYDTEASGKDLRGYARGLFISECLSKGTPGTAEDKPKGAEMIAAKPMAGASNVEQGQATKPTADASRSAQVQDEQFRRWSRAAERATRSICVGCGI